MTNRYEASNLNGFALLSNDNAQADLIARPSGDYASPGAAYLYVEKVTISVSRPAAGGGGILQLIDTNGGLFWQTNVDGVKDFVVDFGEEGVRVGKGVGLQAVLSGASVEQATVSIGVKAHSAFR